MGGRLEYKTVEVEFFLWFRRVECSTEITRRPTYPPPTPLEVQLWRRAYEHYHITVQLFNENFGLCLPVRDFRDVKTPAIADRTDEERRGIERIDGEREDEEKFSETKMGNRKKEPKKKRNQPAEPEVKHQEWRG